MKKNRKTQQKSKKNKTIKNKKTQRNRKKQKKETYSYSDYDKSIGFMNYRACFKNGKKVPCPSSSKSSFPPWML